MLVGYIRVSSDSDRQTTDLQRDALLSAGVDSRHLTNLAAGDTSVGSTPDPNIPGSTADTAPFGLIEHEGAQRRWLQTPRSEALFLRAFEQEGPDVSAWPGRTGTPRQTLYTL